MLQVLLHVKLTHEKVHSHGIRREENLVQDELAVIPPDCLYHGYLFFKKNKTQRVQKTGILEGTNKQEKP